jgi:hypothetical protein
MGLLKAYLMINKRQLNSLRECSIQDFGIQKRINHEFLTFLKLYPIKDELDDLLLSTVENSRELDRQLWSNMDSLLHLIQNDPEIDRIESTITDRTYDDAMRYWQKFIGMSTYKLNLANVPKSRKSDVTVDTIFDPNLSYDYLTLYARLRYRSKVYCSVKV